jgi:ATP-dependent RNA helicase DeaD
MSSSKSFSELGLASNLLLTLNELGYESPTPIQEQSIPVLMDGDDLSAQAQTGTGKTASFALPILAHLDLKTVSPQALVIAPTRELAIQVSEAFQSYAKHLKNFHVLPIYGGQDFRGQLRALKRGVHVVVGTPGRLMDHMRRGTLETTSLKTVVLDEADEMLKMGFIEDIEWILEQIPQAHQTALFSATMPASIQKIAKAYLKKPKKIHIKAKTRTVDAIEQFYTKISREQKLEVLTRFLEIENVEAAIIFSRTKIYAAELAEKLQARGYAAAALHGDMNQAAREKVIDRIKKGNLDIIVATDVAARGIDVERVTHVINYDIPYDTESYIHRIGRTGRAGRTGKALLFVTPRERHMLRDIEREIGKPISNYEPPSAQEMQSHRNQQLAGKIVKIIEKSKKLEPYRQLVTDVMAMEGGYDPVDIAAALAYLEQQDSPVYTADIDTSGFSDKDDHRKGGERRKKPASKRGKPAERGKRERKPFKGKSSGGGRSKEFSRDKKKAGGTDKKRKPFKAKATKKKRA